MEEIIRVSAPLEVACIENLRAGQEVSISGVLYTARDQAHLRLCGLIEEGGDMPIDLEGQVIYYCGPTPAGDRPIGSCGPTTSSRMDVFTPELLRLGVKGMIGKGRRSDDVMRAMRKEKAVYFAAPGGAGAYLSEKVRSCGVVAFEDLGPEAIYRLEVEDFPAIVAVDVFGGDIFSG